MKKFLIAVSIDSTEEDFFGHEIVEANNEDEARKKYHKDSRNNEFEDVVCLGEYDDKTKKVTVPITLFIN